MAPSRESFVPTPWPAKRYDQYTGAVVVGLSLSGQRVTSRGRLAAIFGQVTIAFVVGALLSPSAQAAERVVAIGDIHGAGSRFVALLKHSELIDADLRWIGGSTTLVQTGDFTDRGSQVRDVMDLLMRLEADASAGDGTVRVLLGNHETMNLTANVRDATPAIFQSFASEDAPRRQSEAYDVYADYVRRREQALGRPLPDRRTREEWMATHPLGFVEYMEAMGPDGHYGKWLRSKPIATTVAQTLFLHGGVSPQIASDSTDSLNSTARDELESFDRHRRDLIDAGIILPFSTFQEIMTAVALELNAWLQRLYPGPLPPDRRPPNFTRKDQALTDLLVRFQGIGDWSIFDDEGPLWFRGFARWSSEEGNAAIGGVLERFEVDRAVVGHSVTATRRITPRFGDRVFLIDTGMLAATYRGHASALEILDDHITAIYFDARTPLVTPTPAAR